VADLAITGHPTAAQRAAGRRRQVLERDLRGRAQERPPVRGEAQDGGYHGHDGLRNWWGDFLGAFPDYNLEVEELRDLGDVTLGHMRGWGHGADSATPLVDPFWIPMRWRDGKLVWWRNCSTEAEALEAVGLRE
jgi:SnoaL-like protein